MLYQDPTLAETDVYGLNPEFIKQQEKMMDNLKRNTDKSSCSHITKKRDKGTHVNSEVLCWRNVEQSRKRPGSPTYSPERKRKREEDLDNLVLTSEAYARKLQEQFNKEVDVGSKRDDNMNLLLSQDEKLAKKIAQENSYSDTTVLDDEAVAKALYEEELENNKSNVPSSVDKDAELARQLSEQLNSEVSGSMESSEIFSTFVMGKQMARVEPFSYVGPFPGVNSAWSKQSVRKPSATYTPMSANKANSFENQVSV